MDTEKQAATLQSLVEILPDVINSMLDLYARSYSYTEDKIPFMSYSHSSVRYAKLMVALNNSHGHLNQDILRHVVVGRLLPSKARAEVNSTWSQSKPDIVSLMMRGYPDSKDFSMPASERIAILAAIAGLLAQLECHRKQAFVFKDILSALLPALVQARKDGAAEMGVHPAASLASLNSAFSHTWARTSLLGSSDVDSGMQAFLAVICQTFGVVLPQPDEEGQRTVNGVLKEKEEMVLGRTVATALQHAISSAHGPQDLKIDVLRLCINICEALPDLAGALHYSAILLRTAGSGVAPGPESSNGSPELVIDEQIRLANNISRTLSAAEHLGLRPPEADYWDEFLVRGIKHVSSNQARSLTPHARSELEVAENLEAKKEKNPFIYNPFQQKQATLAEPVLVAHEENVFELLLQNLFDFDIVLDSVILVSHGTKLSCPPQSVVVGPYRTQTMLVKATPESGGPLTIIGCKAKIRGCHERDFAIFSDVWSLKVDVKGRDLRLSNMKDVLEHTGHERRSGKVKSSSTTPGPKSTLLTVKVIENQPLLVLSALSLPQSSIMLLEGEMKTFTLTLHNVSPIAVADLVLLSFVDPTTTRIRDALDSRELSAGELYEMELNTSRRPAFRWANIQDVANLKIEPRGDVQLEIEVYGKPGLTYGTMQVDYGFLGVPRSEINGQFFTRQVNIPITVTVSPSLDLTRNDILPITDIASIAKPCFNTSEETASASSRDMVSNSSQPHCLLLLDFRNLWPSALTLRLKRLSPPSSPGTDSTVSEHSLHSGSITRIPLPISRIYLPSSSAFAPIPSLNEANKRQFVVSANAASPEVECRTREAFWYREEILKRFSAAWHEEASGRSGEVDLRRLAMTSQMVSTYKLDDVAMEMSVRAAQSTTLNAEPTPQVSQTGARGFEVPTSIFLSLTITLRNRSSSPITALLRLQPAIANQPEHTALDLSKKLLLNGVLQRALPVLEANGELTIETGFLVLSRGVYEWNATVEELGSVDMKEDAMEGKEGRPRARTGELDLRIEAQGRRVWHSERPCIVIARDDL